MKKVLDKYFGGGRVLFTILFVCFIALLAQAFGWEDGAPLVMFGALAADKAIEITDGVELALPVINADCIYGGSFVCVNAAGYALPGADTAGLIFMGIATDRADNTSGDAGDITVTVRRRGLIKATLGHTISVANVGDNVFLVDDETVDVAAQTTNDIFCGIIAQYIDTTHAMIDIEPAIKQADVATHIADTSAAHAASAISLTDAGAHFAAADTAETALQALAKTIPLNFSVGTIATAANDTLIAENFELPVATRIKRAYGTLGTAPGEGKTLTIEIKVGSGNDTTLLAIAGTATSAEDEALDIAIAANTDFDVKLTQDTGSADNLNLMLIAQVDDGE